MEKYYGGIFVTLLAIFKKRSCLLIKLFIFEEYVGLAQDGTCGPV
jgi:hypothetical protein